MRRLESTICISSLLAMAACSGEAPGTDLDMGAGGAGSTTGSASSAGVGADTGVGSTGVGAGAGVDGGGSTANAGAASNDDGAAGTSIGAAGGAAPDDDDEDVEVKVPDATVCVPGVPATSQIPRITSFEYENIIADLFNVGDASLTLPTDQPGPITQPTWEGYVSTAKRVATSVIGNPDGKAKLMSCAADASEDDCLTSIVSNIGRKLFRRPLSEVEVAGFQEKIIAQRDMVTSDGSLDETAELILSTLLQSPSFLQRAELAKEAGPDGSFKLSQHEIAARLSFMLWASIPDDDLDAAADGGLLSTKEQVREQALRMLQHENARRVVSTFHQEYLQLTSSGRWVSTSKSPTLYPDFKPDAVGDMIYEELALFDNIFTSGGSFQDLLLTNKAWVTPYTAPLYGLTEQFPAGEYTEVELDGTRPGFLTRVGFLAAFSNPDRTNPIVRGAYIVKEVLGVDPGAPDPNVARTPLPTDPDLLTIRDKVDAMTASPGCANCHHNFINPPGFAMEGFDAAGMAQTAEAASGADVNTIADVRFAIDGQPQTVNNAAELIAGIAASPSAQAHYAKKWVGFAFHRPLTEPDVCTAETLAANTASGGYAIRDLVADITQADYFTTRAIEVTQ